MRFAISENDSVITGAKSRARANIAAIRTMRTLQEETRAATVAEQAAIAQFTGWGGLSALFDEDRSDWSAERDALVGLLSPDEYHAARRSVLDAHYTPASVIRAIYEAVRGFGFDGGAILEPAMGSGRFLGLMPSDLRENSTIHGCELDPIAGALAAALYPEARIEPGKAFEGVPYTDGSMQLVVGNPPYGDVRIHDRDRPELSGLTVHNYFIARSIRLLAPGGILAFVVSNFFLDKATTADRASIAEIADLVGAIRLPEDAFRAAGTDVTTDIVFLRRLREGETGDTDWVGTAPMSDPQTGEEFEVNNYFHANPEMVLGQMAATRYAGRSGGRCIATPDWEERLFDVLDRLPAGVYDASTETAPVTQAPAAFDVAPVEFGWTKPHGLFVTFSGEIAKRLPDVETRDGVAHRAVVVDVPASASVRIAGLCKTRDALRDLMAAELADRDPTALDGLRAALNRTYDVFVRKHGAIHGDGNKRVFRDDPDYPLLLSLELDYDKGISKAVSRSTGLPHVPPSWKKADIFRTRVLMPHHPVESAATVQDALAICLSERGRVVPSHIAALVGMDEAAAMKALGEQIYFDPALCAWVTADEYLSGNVREKLKAAKIAAARDAQFNRNVYALEEAQPKDIEPVDIDVQLGAPWLPASDVTTFLQHLTSDTTASVGYVSSVATWHVHAGDRTAVAAIATWGTPRMDVYALFDAILNSKKIEITYEDDDGKRHVDRDATIAANDKAGEIRDAFADWLWSDAERRVRLAGVYNDTFNVFVARSFDGSHLTFPGMTATIELRPHQKAAAWRAIVTGRVLLDHVVGSGKTFTIIAALMEMRRMGLVKKPVITVPNHLVNQWAADVLRLYPAAKVLAATKADFAKARRQEFFGRAATGDWDIVIIAHSSFERIPMPHEAELYILKEQVNEIVFAVQQLANESGQGLTVYQLEKRKANLESRIKDIATAKEKMSSLHFGEIGFDFLAVDEAHLFKNLFFYTRQRVLGLGNPAGSQKAFDMFVKVRHLTDETGRGVLFATGTPVSNTIAELYTLQRYLSYHELAHLGLVHFDAWARTFGRVIATWELDATGVNYKLASRFAQFTNLPELMGLYGQFADVLTFNDFRDQTEQAGKRFPVPRIKGGKPEIEICPPSLEQQAYMAEIVKRAENKPSDPSMDNMLKITNDARKCGLDMRLIDPTAEDFHDSKVNRAVRNIFAIWREWEADKGTQLVFCDLSTPKGRAAALPPTTTEDSESEGATPSMDDLLASGVFSVYDDMKLKLIAMGVPPDQIAFIHDANTELQKETLFAKMRHGLVRVLFGSTARLGAGTNVQDRLVAEHHLDAPWRPSDIEQREGRILRQGNLLWERDPDNFHVRIVRYATERTYDARMWQTLETKARFINALRKASSTGLRAVEDVGGDVASYAELKAAATGNPFILEQVRLDSELRRLESLAKAHKRKVNRMEDELRYLKDYQPRFEQRRAQLLSDIAVRDQHPAHGTSTSFHITLNGRDYREFDRAEAVIEQVHRRARDGYGMRDKELIGAYRGFSLYVSHGFAGITYTLEADGTYAAERYGSKEPFSPRGWVRRLDNTLDDLEKKLALAADMRSREEREFHAATAEAGKPFPRQDELDQVRADFRAVMAELERMKDPDYEARTVDEVLGRTPESAPDTTKAAAPACNSDTDAQVFIDLFATSEADGEAADFDLAFDFGELAFVG